MTPESAYLIGLAQQITAAYVDIPTLEAVMITGSAAKGIADRYSDIDMTMYYRGEALPAEDVFDGLRAKFGDGERRWLIGDREEGSFAEAFGWRGIEIQIGHTLITSWEETIDFVLGGEDVATSAQKAMEGTLACKALYGERYIEAWQARIADFPDELGRAMVVHNLHFFAIWGLEPHFRTRDASIWYHQILVETAQKLIGILAGLNKLYFTTFQFKRQGRFIEEMVIKPDNFRERVAGLFELELGAALEEVEGLVAEVVALVEVHMPDVDTGAAKARLGWRQSGWEMGG
ncbi:MAG TPA: hypothetical protein VLL52_25560 [Anaerolineae bacterium]|nr:hypothetical protein [Anaerolineae bacterium]